MTRSQRGRARRVAVGVVRAAATALGRRRALRAARFATNVLRFDDGNRIEFNGEQLVQRVALAQPSPVIFDVGANIGQWSTSLLAQPGFKPRLIGFEPASWTYARVSEVLGDAAEVHALALGAEPGHAQLQIDREGSGTNSLVPVDGARAARTSETVRVETVDRFCATRGIDEITLLKIDAEGADLGVILGARGILGSGNVGMIQFEYNWRWIYSRTYLKDVFDLLENYPEYVLAKVTPNAIEPYGAWHHELETFRESNYLIARNDWLSRFPTIDWWGG